MYDVKDNKYNRMDSKCEETTVRRSGRDRDWVLWVISVTFGRLLLKKDYTR